MSKFGLYLMKQVHATLNLGNQGSAWIKLLIFSNPYE